MFNHQPMGVKKHGDKQMSKSIKKILKQMEESPGNVRFEDLCKVCDYCFGKCRQKGTSHRVYKTPWQGNPRVNIQKRKDGKAWKYQVKQVLKAVEKLKTEK